ncbi:glycosyltransferase family 2 protein [Herbiconiux daphne]|uniref:4,4'-diaponeurosporenoate glycosyltransferase n=1 Tax=Herbiconiux daphne TaxID=2970914 RepID=A0ABT2H5P4_9MICO|nr:glycosyltransferase family 2 protein [Herbiconiux daphne]MCS5735256.1 glycosyltransferase [Herbiconiux daphne]
MPEPQPAHSPVAPLTVSVVVPVRDDAASLRACLRALARQTTAPLEIIVVDNASRDDSAQVARAAGARVVREERRGIPAAAATGYDAASGDVIARLDADCIAPPDWIASITRSLNARPDVAAITGTATFHDGPPRWRRLGAHLYLGAYFVSLAPALGHVPLFGSNLALRRDAWEHVRWAVHRHDPELHDDLDLSFHLGAPWKLRFDRSIELQISHRPFTSASALRTRLGRGFRTVFVHWPRELPWLRWRRLIAARRAARAAGRGLPRPGRHQLDAPSDRPGRAWAG